MFRFPGDGFVPARIVATPIEEPGSITFLGERTIAKHPVLQSWQVGSPADVPYDTHGEDHRPLQAGGGLEARIDLPDRAGIQGHRGDRHARELLGSAGFNHATSPCRTHLPDDLPAQERLHAQRRISALRLDARTAPGTTPTSTISSARHEDEPQGLLGQRRRTEDADLRRAEAPDASKIEGRLAGNLDQLPEYQNVPVTVDQLVSFSADLTYSHTRSSLGAVDDEKGQKCRRCRSAATTSTASFFTRMHGTYDDRHAAAARAFVGVAAKRGRLLAAAAERAVRELLLRRIRQQLRRSRGRKTLSRVLQLSGRRDQRDRRPQFRADRWWNGTCRRCGSAASARPGSIRAGCGRRCS